jgi:cytoskeletal protein CcmA (bactofilin family)
MWPWRANSSAADHTSMSVIDQGCEFEGRLTFVGTLILNGKLRGEVLSSDTLIVGEAGELDADVQVGVAIVSGQISGHITARERVEIKETARIIGDIITPTLVLKEGVIFNGHCRMKGEELQVVDKTS